MDTSCSILLVEENLVDPMAGDDLVVATVEAVPVTGPGIGTLGAVRIGVGEEADEAVLAGADISRRGNSGVFEFLCNPG